MRYLAGNILLAGVADRLLKIFCRGNLKKVIVFSQNMIRVYDCSNIDKHNNRL
nr:hypothetical protein [Megamonas hypermegale]